MSLKARRTALALTAAAPILIVATSLTVPARSADERPLPFRSPYDAAFSPDGATVAVSDHTAGTLALIDAATGAVSRQVRLEGRPAGVAWSGDGASVYVAELGARSVAEVDAKAGRVRRRFAVGPRPAAVAVAPKRRLLLATSAGTNTVSVIDLAEGKERARVPVLREPRSVAVTPDETLAVVGNLLPHGDATDPAHAAAVSILDLETLTRTADVRLPGGSSALRGVAVSPDGRWAYCVHTLGRVTMPTTQLERGWVNTNAMSIINLKTAHLYATLLLDRISGGSADPWGIAPGPGGATAWITCAGVHEVMRVDLAALHKLLSGELRDPKTVTAQARRDPSTMNVWLEIKKDTANRRLLANDLAALYTAGLSRRITVPGKGPRGIAVSPDGKRLAVATYFGGHVAMADTAVLEKGVGSRLPVCPSGASHKRLPTPFSMVSLGPGRAPDAARRGEMLFHDATYCFQRWLSCATCHPDGRADGLNWDLLNDGMGNPKNARSLLWSHRTPPVMSRGVRASMEVATAAGFRFIQFVKVDPDDLAAVRAYLRSMTPEKSPYLTPEGGLTVKARRGKAVFEDAKTRCLACHPGPLYTDLRLYDVGTRGRFDRAGVFDNPTLVELWRTAPYLHDGSAPRLRDVLTTHNKKDKHGVTSHLSDEEIDALVAYLLSL